MMYLYQKGTVTIDMNTPEAAPWPVVIGFTAVFVALLYYFKNSTKLKTSPWRDRTK